MLAKQPNNRRVPHILVEKDRPDEDVLDEVYLRFAQSDPFLPIIHFVDHATMGPEALVGLGVGGKVEKWISRHRVRPYKPPTTGNFRPSAWQTILGRTDAHGDWLNYFEKELENQPFQDVLARWVPRFAHEVGAFLFHGLIRTAHAVRALDHKDTPARRGEFARGLALWAIGIKTDPRGHANEPPRDLDVETQLLQSDAHPIKLTEAALRAFDRTEDELFLKAAGKAHGFFRLRSRGRGRTCGPLARLQTSGA